MESNEKGIKVLLVDDDSDISELVEKKFTMSGFEVYSTTNSTEAATMASELVPDVIVLDLMMTRMAGEDVLAQLKADQNLKKIPVLVFTNKGLAEDAQTFLDAGAVRFLIKSDTGLDELVAVVKELAQK